MRWPQPGGTELGAPPVELDGRLDGLGRSLLLEVPASAIKHQRYFTVQNPDSLNYVRAPHRGGRTASSPRLTQEAAGSGWAGELIPGRDPIQNYNERTQLFGAPS